MSTTSMPKPQPLENARREANAPRVQAVDVKEDLVEYMTCYAKQNPAHAALFCLGVGFVLGWKLKPW
jgi:hypothetical protein